MYRFHPTTAADTPPSRWTPCTATPRPPCWTLLLLPMGTVLASSQKLDLRARNQTEGLRGREEVAAVRLLLLLEQLLGDEGCWELERDCGVAAVAVGPHEDGAGGTRGCEEAACPAVSTSERNTMLVRLRVREAERNGGEAVLIPGENATTGCGGTSTARNKRKRQCGQSEL